MTDPKSVLRAFFAAGDAGQTERFKEFLHPDVVVHAPAELSGVGLTNEVENWRRANAAIQGLRHEFLELVGEGTMVAARCIVSGTLNGTIGGFSAQGRRFRVDQLLFARVRESKIEELWELVDSPALFTQLGQSPPRGTS